MYSGGSPPTKRNAGWRRRAHCTSHTQTEWREGVGAERREGERRRGWACLRGVSVRVFVCLCLCLSFWFVFKFKDGEGGVWVWFRDVNDDANGGSSKGGWGWIVVLFVVGESPAGG